MIHPFVPSARTDTRRAFIFPDPVIAADGFTYDRASFADWLERKRKHGRGGPGKARSPVTNAVLPHLKLTANDEVLRQVRERVAAGVAARKEERREAREFLDVGLRSLLDRDSALCWHY